MEFSLSLIKAIIAIFVMIAIGFFLGRKKFFTQSDSAVMSKIALYIACPCIIFKGFMIEYQTERIMGLGMVALGCFVAMSLFALGGRILGKTLHFSAIDQASLMFTNCGNLLIPILSAVMGDIAVFYLAAYIAIHQIIFFTYGVILLQGKDQVNLNKIITNPNIIASILGLIYFFVNGLVTQITFPAAITNAITNFGNLLTPLFMLVLGIGLGYSDLKEAFTNKGAFLVCLFRLIFFPLVLIAILTITRIPAISEVTRDAMFIIVMAGSAPSAATVIGYAALIGADVKRAGAVNVLTTVLCIVTIPVMTIIYTTLFM